MVVPAVLSSIFLISLISHPALAQTSNHQTASADVNQAESRFASSSETGRQPVSSQSKAESKRLYKEGVKYIRGGLFKQAVAILSRAVDLNPDYADAYYGLGYSYFELRQWRKARESLRELLKLNPKDSQGQSLLSLVASIEESTRRESESRSLEKPVASDPPVDRESEIRPLEKRVAASPPVDQPTDVPVSAKVSSTSTTSEKVDETLTRTYRVGPGDLLDVRLSDDANNKSTLFTVTSLGLLEHPSLPNPLPVAGLTVEEITLALRADLRRRGLDGDTTILLGVRDYASHAILVSGLVKEAGTKILRREAIPLYVVVAEAQPLPEAARLTLVRSKSGESLTINLNETKEMDQLVLPGDVITFHPNVTQFFYVSGEVKSPGEKTFRRGLSLTQALMMAGGLTPKAKEARVSRDDGNGFLAVTRYKLKDIESGKLRDPFIQAGDRITVVD
jgi:protein involved in polysaccharide export with SLBB domain